MKNDMLKYEVQRIDGSSNSIRHAIDLIITELSISKNISHIVEQSFLNEYMKCILNWIGMGDTLNIKETFNSIKEVLRSDSELISFTENTSKQRFGLQLNTLNNMLEVYLLTDLESKNYLKLMNIDKKNMRIRTLFHLFFEIGKSVSSSELESYSLYKNKGISRKTIERDLEDLIELKLLRKLYISERKIIYELTPNAFYWKDKIKKPASNTEKIKKPYSHTIVTGRTVNERTPIGLNINRPVKMQGKNKAVNNNKYASKSNKYSVKIAEVKNHSKKVKSEKNDLFKHEPTEI